MYQDTMLLTIENGMAQISLDGDEWIDVNIDVKGLKDDEYLIEFYIDVIGYDPGRDAPAPKNDILMATPPEPEEVDYEIVGAVIFDNDFNEKKKLTIADACKIVGKYEETIYECVLEYARERYNGSLYN